MNRAFLLGPATLPRLNAVDERYQSYNVEMAIDFAHAVDARLVTSFAIIPVRAIPIDSMKLGQTLYGSIQ